MKPCPFCGSIDIIDILIDIRQKEGQLISVRCCDCGAEGPSVYVNDPKRDSCIAHQKWDDRYEDSKV